MSRIVEDDLALPLDGQVAGADDLNLFGQVVSAGFQRDRGRLGRVGVDGEDGRLKGRHVGHVEGREECSALQDFTTGTAAAPGRSAALDWSSIASGTTWCTSLVESWPADEKRSPAGAQTECPAGEDTARGSALTATYFKSGNPYRPGVSGPCALRRVLARSPGASGLVLLPILPQQGRGLGAKRISSSSLGWFFSIHATALSYQDALGLVSELPVGHGQEEPVVAVAAVPSSIDFVRASIAAFQSPAR